jgi:ABC-2 type transport system permease protein
VIRDAQTVAWKDLRELLLRRGSLRHGVLGALIPVLIFGVGLGSQPQGPFPIVAFLPVILVAGVVADGFAGERERHTLETLLATPASDRALLLGKVSAYVGYGWSLCLGSIAVGALIAGAAHTDYPVDLVVFDCVFTLVVSVLTAALGVLVSLRAETVRAAARTLGLLNIPLLVVAGAARAATVDAGPLGAVVSLAVLGALASGLFTAGEVRFRRGRLLLD